MRVSIAGAGNVGRFIARDLISNGHHVLLIEKEPSAIKKDSVPQAEWLLADACELGSLTEAHLETCDVAIAATGDDKVNLVHSLLAKTEFGVPRTVGRVNHPGNEWLFDDVWGVDVAVSAPRIMTALAEEAVTVGDLVRLFSFRRSDTDLVEMTLPEDSPCVTKSLGDIHWPEHSILVALIRGGRGLPPEKDVVLEAGDELLFIAPKDAEQGLKTLLSPQGELHVSETVPAHEGPGTPAPMRDRDVPRVEDDADYVL
ncbi:MAG: TrkA family potassium uptake protein [Propionibacteriaceae bacterium]|jgi:trk system potassium uptake protein TrkA|nr:TrkA family potassium uptake protein [Propionibacteriaceae bacterium]